MGHSSAWWRPVHRRRALATAALALTVALVGAGCGGAADTTGNPASTQGSTAPSILPAVAPARTSPLKPGDTVSVSKQSPRALVAALARHKPVVVALFLRGMADDDLVAAALTKAKASPAGSGAVFLVYDMQKDHGFGDIPSSMGLTSSPAVVAIGRDGKVVNAWIGTVIDQQMIRQAVVAAKDTTAG
ncbi:MAG: hypothetical protein U0Y82_16640 [Thermoleophilia bacterium]